MPENFPDLKKETDIQVQEAQKVPNKMNPNRSIPRHIIINMAKVKDREFSKKQETRSYIQRNPHNAIS